VNFSWVFGSPVPPSTVLPRTTDSSKALILIALLASMCSMSCTFKSEDENKVVRIAGNVPLTGKLSPYGNAIHDGSTLAAEELSQRQGQQFYFDWQDNESNPAQAKTVAAKQLSNNPDIYVSAMKDETDAIAKDVNSRGIPHFVF
jgi:ABC-type branched-subunit amino acid transport system substrate-binding protein